MLPSADRIDVTAWDVLGVEPIGDDAKQWLVDADGTPHLWKPVTRQDGWRQGEDWAELLVHAVAVLLGVPSAPIRLAQRDGQDGLLSQDVTPCRSQRAARSDGDAWAGARWSSYPGTDLLAEIVPGYDRRAKERTGHNLGNIGVVLDGVGPPLDAGCEDLSAYDVFCGYLLLDALVSGQDRHSDNWSVAVSVDGERRLLPSYDHASSLAFNHRDSWRRAQLTDEQGVSRWVRRGCAQRFEAGKDVSLVDWAMRALDSASAEARARWSSAMQRFDPAPVGEIATRIPAVSEVGRTFVMAVLTENTRRLVDELARRSSPPRRDAGDAPPGDPARS